HRRRRDSRRARQQRHLAALALPIRATHFSSTISGGAMKRWQMWIDGAWRDAESGATFERRSPANGEAVGVYPEADLGDVERAIDAARRAFDDGRWSGAARPRAEILRKTAELVRANAESLAKNITA